jgi:tetratricopeptide (TPR) repeat protein
MGDVHIFGTLVFGDSSPRVINWNTSNLIIESTGEIEFSNQKTDLYLPSGAIIKIIPGGQITGACSNNTEIYIGRTATPVAGLFNQACKIINENFVTAGGLQVTGEAREEVLSAKEMLDEVLASEPNWWNGLWFQGKAQIALGNYEEAYARFSKAYEIERKVEAIPRELSGVCLELGRFEEAVEVSEGSAALSPADPEILGNLSLAYLLAGRTDAATRTIGAALKLDQDDKINQSLEGIIGEVSRGARPAPQTLKELRTPSARFQKPFWKFW